MCVVQVLIMTIEVLERGMMADVLPLDMLNLLVITDAHRMATCPTVHKVMELPAEVKMMLFV